ncbi:hypothetical protein Nwi_1489 [Nitrobacter winogradskyi Nb-255]|uniref:Uncharacterized protein n=2 Tax=Nitrobacter winogradskyi TaxID=913 RepID=Q3SSJ1_NITWN|nr:hypothetical protein Nwi_1489 [Nitrobacter winogradskyi Nb-255]
MAQAESVLSTPPTNTSAQTIIELPQRAAGERLRQLAAQQRRAEKTRQRVRELREMASAEIERLIAFLDASDGYTMHELEAAVDDIPCDDNELDGAGDVDGEPSLGSANPHEVSAGVDQRLWAVGAADDREQDAAESGIADFEGLLEQIGQRDWQHTVMG